VTEDLIPKEDDVITITIAVTSNASLWMHISSSAVVGRCNGYGDKEEDFVSDLFIGNTHDYLLFFTDKGKVYWLKVYGIPEAGRQARALLLSTCWRLNRVKRSMHIYRSASSMRITSC